MTDGNSKNKLLNSMSGFTIVELLVVIVVIAILAALISVSYSGINQKATIASLQSDLKNSSIKLAIEKVNNEVYPSSIDAIDGGKGLQASSNNIYEYTGSDDNFCLSAVSGNLAYYISSENGVPTPGVCPGHTDPNPMTSGWKQISAGQSTTCGIAYNNHAYCWGSGDYGQLGNNTDGGINWAPIAILQGEMPSLEVKAIATGGNHSCVIAINNQAYCWGRNTHGQLGNGTSVGALTPVAVLQGEMPSLTFKSILTGRRHTCAIASNDQAYCWGDGTDGILANNSNNGSTTPISILRGEMPSLTVKSLSAGNGYNCAIASNNQMYCWGNNWFGQIGNNTHRASHRYTPTAVFQGSRPDLAVKSIGLNGAAHSCAISSDDQAYCWGFNNIGQVGNNTYLSGEDDQMIPATVAQGATPNSKYKQVQTGESFTCGMSTNDQIFCWGSNGYGQLGALSISYSLAPVAVVQGLMPSLTVKSFSVGYFHACAITSDNQAYCWGWNNRGQLGEGTIYTGGPSPVKVVSPI